MIDAELGAVNARLGQPTRRVSSNLGDLVYVHVKDESGVEIERVLAGWRKMLLETHPLDDDAEDAVAAPTTGVKACSVCAHEAASEIQAALDASESLRDLEQRYGVSRSALSRHRQHAND